MDYSLVKNCVLEIVVIQAEKDDILAYHNELRSRVARGVEPLWPQGLNASNMNKLVWNDELAKFAQVWANQCGNGHDKNRKSPNFTGFNGQGQNAAATWTSSDGGKDSFADFKQVLFVVLKQAGLLLEKGAFGSTSTVSQAIPHRADQ